MKFFYAPTIQTYPAKGKAMRQFCVAESMEAAVKIAKDIGEKCISGGGRTIWADGTSEFIRVSALRAPGADGTFEYVWDEDGNKVKCERTRITVSDGKVINERLLGTSWRVASNVI